MTQYIYLFCHKNNISGSVTTAAYSSENKAMKEYSIIRDRMAGHVCGSVSEETTGIPEHLAIQYGDKLVKHCYVGPQRGNTHADSYYILRKVLN